MQTAQSATTHGPALAKNEPQPFGLALMGEATPGYLAGLTGTLSQTSKPDTGWERDDD